MADDKADIRAIAGLDPAIDAVAARAAPDRAFLTEIWFAAAAPERPVTLVHGDRIALPVGRHGRLLRTVPGCYWPFRSFPVAIDATAEDMAALLCHPAARAALGIAWRLGPVYDDDPALALLRAAAPRAGWLVAERGIATAYALDLPEGWPRSSTMQGLRRKEKKLAEGGALDFRFLRGADWTPALFETLAAIEAKSWQGQRGDPKFLPGATRAFWERLAADPVQADRMSATVLDMGGTPIAFAFDLEAGGLKYWVANGYDPALSRNSPGKSVLYRNFIEGRERGIARVDCGAGDGGYKQEMDAVPGARIVDCMILRTGLLAPLARLAAIAWRRSGQA